MCFPRATAGARLTNRTRRMMAEPTRCGWATWGSDLMLRYHDEEWGVPLHDDRRLFELLILEGAQAGLSWNTVLNKREHSEGIRQIRL